MAQMKIGWNYPPIPLYLDGSKTLHEEGFLPATGMAIAFTTQDGYLHLGEAVLLGNGSDHPSTRTVCFFEKHTDAHGREHRKLHFEHEVASWQSRIDDRPYSVRTDCYFGFFTNSQDTPVKRPAPGEVVACCRPTGWWHAFAGLPAEGTPVTFMTHDKKNHSGGATLLLFGHELSWETVFLTLDDDQNRKVYFAEDVSHWSLREDPHFPTP